MTIASHFQTEGLSIEAKGPIWNDDGFFDDALAEKLESYLHTLLADGGYNTANIVIITDINTADSWLESGIGRDITTFNTGGDIIFNGFVNEIIINIGSLSAKRGPLLDVVNRTSVTYQTVRYDTNPPIGGMQLSTATANNTDSQTLYGIMEGLLSGGEATATEAEQVRDTQLAEMAEPEGARALSIGAGQTVSITLSCLGYVHIFRKYYYTQIANAGTETIDAKIKLVIAADPSTRFSTDVTKIEANGFLVNRYENGERTASTILEELVSIGDTSDNRTILGVFDQRRVHYNTVPTIIKYFYALSDPEQLILDAGNNEVKYWDILPGQWLQLTDFLVAQPESSDLRVDQRNIFIESVTYEAPQDIQINGVKVTTLGQKLAKRGLQ